MILLYTQAFAAQKIYIPSSLATKHLKYSRRIMQPCGSRGPVHLPNPFTNLLIVEVTYAGSVTMESGTAIRWCTGK